MGNELVINAQSIIENQLQEILPKKELSKLEIYDYDRYIEELKKYAGCYTDDTIKNRLESMKLLEYDSGFRRFNIKSSGYAENIWDSLIIADNKLVLKYRETSNWIGLFGFFDIFSLKNSEVPPYAPSYGENVFSCQRISYQISDACMKKMIIESYNVSGANDTTFLERCLFFDEDGSNTIYDIVRAEGGIDCFKYTIGNEKELLSEAEFDLEKGYIEETIQERVQGCFSK